MELELIKKLQYSYSGQNSFHLFPQLLVDSLNLISDFFKKNNSNKLCLVFPSKELAAQWISMPLSLKLLEDEFQLHKKEINEAYKLYKPGQRLLLNNEALVEWVEGDSETIKFRAKGNKKKKYWESTSGDVITISSNRINNLRPAPKDRSVLSSREIVYRNLKPKIAVPIDKLLEINSNGNLLFQKQSICLVSRFKSFEESISQIQLNGSLIEDYFHEGRIDEEGKLNEQSPLIVTNSLQSLWLYLSQTNNVSKIIIDSYKAIYEKGVTDFSDIDRGFNLPTILITDLSEIESFENIGNHGFNFYSFTKENLSIASTSINSPFYSLESKNSKYATFNFHNVVCKDDQVEQIFKIIHSIDDDESDANLAALKTALVQIANHVSRIISVLDSAEALELNQKLEKIESLFQQNRRWIGNSAKPCEEAIKVLKSAIDRFSSLQSIKCEKLIELITNDVYNYIICVTEREVHSLRRRFSLSSFIKHPPKILSVSEVDDSLISTLPVNAILIGWPKSNNFNRLLSSFLFSRLTVLFYEFENHYYNSLQRRNLKNISNVKSTVVRDGSSFAGHHDSGFSNVFKTFRSIEQGDTGDFDVISFELKLEDFQYSKYRGKPDSDESIKVKRIDFENNTFIFSSESHKFLVLSDLVNSRSQNQKIHYKKIDSLHIGDLIALINTDRDILADLVEQNTKPDELQSIKSLTDSWKNLLREYYNKIGNDFKKLVSELRKLDCTRHEATIRNWLNDENRIGPDDDLDLMSIALLTESEFLSDNIPNVRKAIDQMIKWRFQASDYVREKIERELAQLADHSVINSTLEIQDLGEVDILRIHELNKTTSEIDKRFANRLLKKEV